MPISVPVPKEFAQKYDEKTPSTLRRGGRGLHRPVHGRVRRARARRPATWRARRSSWSATRTTRRSTTSVPAYLDEIEFQAGNDDTAVATRRILSGENLAGGDIEPPARQLKTLLESNKTELSAVPGGGWRMISMDNSKPAVRRHQRPQGRDRGLQPQRRPPAARWRGARPDRPGLHPAGHGRVRGVRRRRGLHRRAGLDGEARGRPRPVGRVLQEGRHDLRQVRGRRGGPDRRRQRRPGQVDRADHRAAAQRDGLQDEAPPRHARHDVHEVLQRAGLRRQRLPERRAGRRTSRTPQTMLDPTFNGENDHPVRQLELARAGRPGHQQGDRRRQARHRPGRARSGLGRREQA